MSTLFRGSLAGSLAQELGGEMEVFLQQSGGAGGSRPWHPARTNFSLFSLPPV